MSILVKEGVRFHRFYEQVYHILPLIDDIFQRHGVEAVITSAADGIHSSTSFHYLDLALDLRSRHLSSRWEKNQVLGELSDALGPDYDVLFEDPGGLNEHFHIEFDRD